MRKITLSVLVLLFFCASRVGAGEAVSDTAKSDAAPKTTKPAKNDAAKTKSAGAESAKEKSTTNGTAKAAPVKTGTTKDKTAKNGTAKETAAKTGTAKEKSAKTAATSETAVAKPKSAEKVAEKKPAVASVDVSGDASMVHMPVSDTSGYFIIRSDGSTVAKELPEVMSEEEYAALLGEEYVDEELVAEYVEEDDAYIFPNGVVVMGDDGSVVSSEPVSISGPISISTADTGRTSYWPCSWDDFSVSKDYSNGKGFIVYANAGYKWVFLRKMGFNVGGNDMRRNLTISGGTAALGFGYSFGDDVPIALEVDIGVGPTLVFNNHKVFGADLINSRQKLNIYNLDASIDYDIKTNSKFTPFIGINTGLALISDRGRVEIRNGGAVTARGEYDRKHRVNLMGGLRLGSKLQVHERVTLSAVAEYNYLGDIPAQQFVLNDGVTQASTKRIKAHEFNLKLGAKLHF